MGKPEGKSAIVPRERHPERGKATGGDCTLWARGYYAGTVGPDESIVRRYIRRQEDGSRIE